MSENYSLFTGGMQCHGVICCRQPNAPRSWLCGVVYIEGSAMFMTGLGFRFNPLGAFATIPIMNWTGMFPPLGPTNAFAPGISALGSTCSDKDHKDIPKRSLPDLLAGRARNVHFRARRG